MRVARTSVGRFRTARTTFRPLWLIACVSASSSFWPPGHRVIVRNEVLQAKRNSAPVRTRQTTSNPGDKWQDTSVQATGSDGKLLLLDSSDPWGMAKHLQSASQLSEDLSQSDENLSQSDPECKKRDKEETGTALWCLCNRNNHRVIDNKNSCEDDNKGDHCKWSDDKSKCLTTAEASEAGASEADAREKAAEEERKRQEAEAVKNVEAGIQDLEAKTVKLYDAKHVFERAEKELDSLKKEAVREMKEKEAKVKGHIEKLDAFIKEHELNDAKEIEFSEKISGEK